MHNVPRLFFIWWQSFKYQENLFKLFLLIIFLFQPNNFQSPSTLGEEKEYNPFLRSHALELQRALGLQQNQDEDWTAYRARVLEELRRRKDIYKSR